MEWDLKLLPHSWDLAELETGIHSVGGGGGGGGGGGHDCSVDLKLGGLGEFGLSDSKWRDQQQQQPRMSTVVATVPPTASTSKRARTSSNGRGNAACLVDGCVSDLSKCREYHRRHKVCEVHSKTPVVMVGGREQRFCQQCSRFHFLIEFDEVKRSCRKRLDGHNRRRRKPQPDFINTKSMITNHPGARFSVYPQIFPVAAPEPNWTRIIKSEEDVLYADSLPLHLMDRQHQHFPSSSCSYKEGKRFPFLHDGNAAIRSSMLSGNHACQPEHKTNASLESSHCKIFPNETGQILNFDCALSLLSSSSQTAGIGLTQVVPVDRIPMGQPLVSGLHYNELGRYSDSQASSTVFPNVYSSSGMKDGQTGTAAFVPEASENNLHCGCIFQIGDEGSFDGTSQALPFSWQQ